MRLGLPCRRPYPVNLPNFVVRLAGGTSDSIAVKVWDVMRVVSGLDAQYTKKSGNYLAWYSDHDGY